VPLNLPDRDHQAWAAAWLSVGATPIWSTALVSTPLRVTRSPRLHAATFSLRESLGGNNLDIHQAHRRFCEILLQPRPNFPLNAYLEVADLEVADGFGGQGLAELFLFRSRG